ncbi:hypothetical protein AB0L70_37080 [Kribbella sp. NPDC051952]|uniref:hypothetical protein n=1 Tax=Kribbella sp. NPDC051952 TaxID=3154851 RepID=UPI00344225B9
MLSKLLPPVLTLLAAVWMIFLFCNSPDVTYSGKGLNDGDISVSCIPFGNLGPSERRSMEHGPVDWRIAAQKYAEQLKAAGDGNASQDVVTELEQTITGDCQRAKQDRLALLIVAALITGVLATFSLLRLSAPRAPFQRPSPAYAPQPMRGPNR